MSLRVFRRCSDFRGSSRLRNNFCLGASPFIVARRGYDFQYSDSLTAMYNQWGQLSCFV